VDCVVGVVAVHVVVDPRAPAIVAADSRGVGISEPVPVIVGVPGAGDVLVRGSVAVVVHAVANLVGERMRCGIGVVAVVCLEGAIAVQVVIQRGAVAVVVGAVVGLFGLARVDRGAGVVAVDPASVAVAVFVHTNEIGAGGLTTGEQEQKREQHLVHRLTSPTLRCR